MSSQTSTVNSPQDESEGGAVSNAAHQIVDGVTQVLTKPRFRGWIHVYSAGTAVFAGASLIAVSWAVGSTRAGLATFAYTAATILMFTVSATYHRVHWKSPTARKWMKRADHSMIFVFIAGSYTPFALLALPGHDGHVVLSIVWGGALAGVLLKMLWPSSPRWVGVPLYILLGWVAVWYTGEILHNAGVTAMVLAVRRRRPVQHRRRPLRAALARPVAVDLRLPRVLSRVHGGGGDLPLHRHVVRGVLICWAAERHASVTAATECHASVTFARGTYPGSPSAASSFDAPVTGRSQTRPRHT